MTTEEWVDFRAEHARCWQKHSATMQRLSDEFIAKLNAYAPATEPSKLAGPPVEYSPEMVALKARLREIWKGFERNTWSCQSNEV